MPGRIQAPVCTDTCPPSDVTAPPTPQVQRALTFERAANDATFRPNPPPSSPGRTVPPRDPAYIELANVEVGTKLQIINLSGKPNAAWGNKDDVIELPLTGRDVQNRQAGVYLSQEQLEQLKLQPGDVLQLRAVDAAGNASAPTTLELEPDDWANGQVREKSGDTFVTTPGTQFSALDGEGVRKPLIVKTVADTRPPEIVTDRLALVTDDRFSEGDKSAVRPLFAHHAALQQALGKSAWTKDDLVTIAGNDALPEEARNAAKALVANTPLLEKLDWAATNDPSKANGQFDKSDLSAILNFAPSVTLKGSQALEPRTNLTILNQRTGAISNASVGDNRELSVVLPNLLEGDPLFITPTDNEGVRGKTVELVYSAKCADGKATTPSRPVIGGVI